MKALPFLLLFSQQAPVDLDAEALIRRVVNAQRLAEQRLTSYTYDQRVVETKYDRHGRIKDLERRLFYALSGENGEEGTRELIEVDDRPATADEKREAAEKDAKDRQKRIEDRAARQAERTPKVTGEEDDPLVGTRRLSVILDRYDYEVTGEELLDGHAYYSIRFRAKPNVPAKTLAEKALSSLAGTALVSASTFQIRSIDAHLIRPVKLVGGVAASVHDALITFDATTASGRWLPCRVELRLKGKTAIFFRLDTAYRFELSGYRTFEVETDTRPSLQEIQ